MCDLFENTYKSNFNFYTNRMYNMKKSINLKNEIFIECSINIKKDNMYL